MSELTHDPFDTRDRTPSPTTPPDAQAMTQEQIILVESGGQDAVNFAMTQAETIRRLEVERDEAWAHHRGHCRIAEAYDEEMKTLQARLSESEKAAYDVNNTIEHLQARLTASEAKHKWTTARPTVAGMYWWRANRTAAAQIIKVLDDFTAESMTGCSDHVDEIGGEWQGPLTPGEE